MIALKNYHFYNKYIKMCICIRKRKVEISRTVVSYSAIPWTVACQAPLSMKFSRQEYWRGLPFPSSGDLPYPGIKPWSPPLQADSLPSEPPEKPKGTWERKRWDQKNVHVFVVGANCVGYCRLWKAQWHPEWNRKSSKGLEERLKYLTESLANLMSTL